MTLVFVIALFPGFLPANNFSNDSLKVMQIFDSAYLLEITHPDSAINLYKKGIVLSEKINFRLGTGKGLQYTGIVFSDQGKYDSAVRYYLQSLEIFKDIGYKKGIGSTFVNLGNVYQRQAMYTDAVNEYIEGIKIFEEIGDTARLIYAYGNIGGIFSEVEQYGKCLYYYNKSLELSRIIKDSTSVGFGLYEIGVTKMKQGSYTEAEEYLNKALLVAEMRKDLYLLTLVYNTLSAIDSEKGNFKGALLKAKQSYRYAQRLGKPADKSLILSRIGYAFKQIHQTDSASFYLMKSIKLAKEHNVANVYLSAYKWMAEVEKTKHNYKSALYWQLQYDSLYNASMGDKQKRIISGLEIEYETEKKDLELTEKTLEIERNKALLDKRNYFIIALLGALISAFVFLWLIRRSLHQKKVIAENRVELEREKVAQLEKEKEVIALRSMIEGQENERRRVARDLHDGLGGLLSSIKLYLNNIKTSEKNLSNFGDLQKAIELVNTTSIEARQIAHNMMPEALVKFGLEDAVRDYCVSISSTKSINIDFQSYGFDKRLSQSTEIMTYRIIQELVNNIIKHSGATEAIVQLLLNKKVLHITVEDNGSGFDTGKINKTIGIDNLKSRVDHLNGVIEIESEINEGTTFNINIPVV